MMITRVFVDDTCSLTESVPQSSHSVSVLGGAAQLPLLRAETPNYGSSERERQHTRKKSDD